MARWRQTGSLAPDTCGGHKKPTLEVHALQVKQLVEEEPDHTRAAMQDTLAKARIVGSVSALDRLLASIAISQGFIHV